MSFPTPLSIRTELDNIFGKIKVGEILIKLGTMAWEGETAFTILLYPSQSNPGYFLSPSQAVHAVFSAPAASQERK